MNKIEDLVDSSDFVISKKRIVKRGFKVAKGARDASDWKGPKLGSAIMYKNKVLSVGWNKHKETRLQKTFNKYRHFDADVYKNCEHAEIHAIRNLLHDYNLEELDCSKLTIFTYREWKNGTPALAKPCIACEMAMKNIGIRHCFYTGENKIIYEIFNKEERKE